LIQEFFSVNLLLVATNWR